MCGSAGIAALALTSRRADNGAIAPLFGSRPGRAVTASLAICELIATSSRPPRAGSPPDHSRLTLAATAAAGMAVRDGELPASAVAVAAVSALGSAALGIRLRALAARRFGSDLPGAFVEDALADTLAWLFIRRR